MSLFITVENVNIEKQFGISKKFALYRNSQTINFFFIQLDQKLIIMQEAVSYKKALNTIGLDDNLNVQYYCDVSGQVLITESNKASNGTRQFYHHKTSFCSFSFIFSWIKSRDIHLTEFSIPTQAANFISLNHIQNAYGMLMGVINTESKIFRNSKNFQVRFTMGYKIMIVTLFERFTKF